MLRLLPSFLLLAQSLAQTTPNPSYNPPNATAGLQPSTASPNTQWATVLGNALWFYDAQRSGNLSDGTYPNRVAWRNNSALSDGGGYGLDLSGGWYDAGDVGVTAELLQLIAVHQVYLPLGMSWSTENP